MITILDTKEITEPNHILYFYAQWMIGNSKMISLLQKIEKEYNVQVYNIDVDYFKSLVSKRVIDSVPCIMFYKDSVMIKRISGMVLITPVRSICNKIYKEQNENKTS